MAVAGAMLVLCASPVGAGQVRLDVDKQEKSLWCWSAAAQSAVRYYNGTTPSRCDLFKAALGASKCENVAAGFISDMDALYSSQSVNQGLVLSAMISLNGLRYDVDENRVLQVRYGYADGQAVGHVVTIYSYSGSRIY